MKRFLNRPYLILLLILIAFGPLENLITGGVKGMVDWCIGIACMLPGIVIGVSLHEFAHAKAAVLCGDPTPLYMGRVSLDPRDHFDPLGLFCLIFIRFGWGKPVVINPQNFRHTRRDSIIVGLAGVTMNLAAAVVFSVIVRLFALAGLETLFTNSALRIAASICMYVVWINLTLMFFNLLPVPPLDGFGVVADLFDLRSTAIYDFVYRNGMLILLLLIMFRIPSRVISIPIYYTADFIMSTLLRFPYWGYLLM